MAKNLLSPTLDQLLDAHLDITKPKYVHVDYSPSKGGVLWINIDGVCVLRVCRPEYFQVGDKIIKDWPVSDSNAQLKEGEEGDV